MMLSRSLTTTEQKAENLQQRAHWENHVVGIFSSFLASVIVLTIVLSLIGAWLLQFMHL